MAYRPKPAGPRNIRELFHYLWGEFGAIGREIETQTGATVENVGGGAGIALPPVVQADEKVFPFKTLIEGENITITEQAQTITIAGGRSGNRVFFQPDQPTDEEASMGDIWFRSGYE